MRVNRFFVTAALVVLVLVGAGLAFDPRFVPLVTLKNNPLFVALVYSPTMFFAVLALLKLRRGQLWLPFAFAIGIIGTGVFHQVLITDTYANPGYMVPIGHLLAPIVSLAAYAMSMVGVYLVVRIVRARQCGQTGLAEENEIESEMCRQGVD